VNISRTTMTRLDARSVGRSTLFGTPFDRRYIGKLIRAKAPITMSTDDGPQVPELVGTLEPGRLADLVVVRSDPLQDIGNMRRIDLVMKEGAVVDRERLPTRRVLAFDPEAEWPSATKRSGTGSGGGQK